LEPIAPPDGAFLLLDWNTLEHLWNTFGTTTTHRDS